MLLSVLELQAMDDPVESFFLSNYDNSTGRLDTGKRLPLQTVIDTTLVSHRTNGLSRQIPEPITQREYRRIYDEVHNLHRIDNAQARKTLDLIDIKVLQKQGLHKLKKQLDEIFAKFVAAGKEQTALITMSAEEVNLCASLCFHQEALGPKYSAFVQMAQAILKGFNAAGSSWARGNRVMAALPVKPAKEEKSRQDCARISSFVPVQTSWEYAKENDLVSAESALLARDMNFDELVSITVNKLGYKTTDEFLTAINNEVVVDLGSGFATLAKAAKVKGATPRKFINVNPAITIAPYMDPNRRQDQEIIPDYASMRDDIEAIYDETKALYWDEMDASKLGVNNGSLGLVVSSSAFPEYARTADEVMKVFNTVYDLLKPGGEFRISPVIAEDHPVAQFRDYASFISMPRLEKLLANTKFEIVESEPVMIRSADGSYQASGDNANYLVLRKPRQD